MLPDGNWKTFGFLRQYLWDQKVKVKVFPVPMAHRVALISVSVAPGHMQSHTSANVVKATAGGWSTGRSACV